MELGEHFVFGGFCSGGGRHVMMVRCPSCSKTAALVSMGPKWQHEIDFAANGSRAMGWCAFVAYESSIHHIDYDCVVLDELAEADFAAYLARIHRCEA